MRPPAARLMTFVVLAAAAACVDVPEDFVRPRVGSVTLVSGANQVTQVGSDAITPQLRVLGPDSVPLRGIEVRFTAVDTLTGASVFPRSVRTDSLGYAQPNQWTVSSVPGLDTLIAIVVGTGTYRFLATVTPPCVGSTSMLPGDSVTGQVTSAGCLTNGGRHATAYQLNPPPGGASSYTVLLRMTGTGYRGRLDLQRNGILLASSSYDTSTVNPNASTVIALLPSVPVTLLAQSEAPVATGTFGIFSTSAFTYTGCRGNVFIVPGAGTSQSIDAGGCPLVDGANAVYLSHHYRIRLSAGQRVVVRMASTVITPFLVIFDSFGRVVAQDDAGTPAAVALQFTATAAGYYSIAALSSGGPGVFGGPYTISVDP